MLLYWSSGLICQNLSALVDPQIPTSIRNGEGFGNGLTVTEPTRFPNEIVDEMSCVVFGKDQILRATRGDFPPTIGLQISSDAFALSGHGSASRVIIPMEALIPTLFLEVNQNEADTLLITDRAFKGNLVSSLVILFDVQGLNLKDFVFNVAGGTGDEGFAMHIDLQFYYTAARTRLVTAK
jgi:hypothetical protein